MAAPSSAQKTVLIAGGLMGSLTLYQARKGSAVPSGGVFKQVWAIGVLTLALAAAADFAPQLVVPFAVAVVAGFTLRKRGDLFGTTQKKEPVSTRQQREGGTGGTVGFGGSTGAHPGAQSG